MLTMYQQITIHTLHKQGLKQSVIARQLDCHRHTVANILKRGKFIEKQTRQKGSLFDPYKKQIEEWIGKKITILRMFELLTGNHGVKSTYVNLCKYIQARFPKPVEAFGVQEATPGETAEVDFGYLGMLPGPSGIPVKTYALAVILLFSRLGYYAVTYDQKLETLTKELENAFLYFGGIPKRLKVDNMKAAILKNQHYDLEFNQDFLEFCYHYKTVIVSCTPYSPEQKGTVESSIKYLKNNFIPGRVFQDFSDLKRQLDDWMINYANRRIHGTTRKIPREVFAAEEKDKLQRLPDAPFTLFNRGVRTVSANCHIHFENNYYSVPSCLVGKEVTVRWNDHLVRVIYKGEQVALHKKTEGIGNYVTSRSHLPEYKIYSRTEHQARFETQFAAIGEHAHEYFHYLLEKESYWFRIVRSILGLRERYGDEAVNSSLKRALYYKVRDVVTIKNILEKKLYLLSEEPRLLDGSCRKEQWEAEQTGLFRELTYYTQDERSLP